MLDIDILLDALDRLQSGFAIYDGDFAVVYANKAARSCWPVLYAALEQGVPRREAVRMQIASMYPDWPEATIEKATDYTYKAQMSSEPHEILTADRRVMRTHHERLGESAFLGISIDLTELKRKERERDHLVAVMDANGIGAWEWRVHEDQVRVSPEWARINGLPETTRAVPLDFITQTRDADDLAKAWANIYAHMRGESEYYHAELRVRRPDGGDVWFSDKGRVIERGADGAPLRMVGLLSDITEQRKLQARAAEAIRQFEAFFAVSRDCFCILTTDGRIVRTNPAFDQTVQRTPAQVCLIDLVHPDDARETAAAIAEAGAGAAARTLLNRCLSQGGAFRHMEWRMSLADGMIYAAGRDVSDRLAYEAELEAARLRAEMAARSKSAFLANMSHEIRTPLNGVIGVADLLAKTALNERQREMVGLVRHSGDMLQRLLDDILDMSKIEAGKIKLHNQVFDLEAEIIASTLLFRARAEEKAIKLTVAVDEAARGRYRSDPVRLRQIVSNLISNAVKFTETGGVAIAVRLDEPSGLRIDVCDTGIGFDADAAERLFERFEQADGSVTRRFGGSGLGLSIVRGLVELMGGTIEARSAPGHGSTFIVRLPVERVGDGDGVSAAPNSAEPGAIDFAGGPAPLRVLLAEDHPTNRRVVGLILEPYGAEIAEAENGRQAVEAFRSAAFDLVLMDMQMPELDGLSATRAIREIERRQSRSRTPIIMLSANVLEEHRTRAFDAGCDMHIAKPITPEALLRGIREALAAG